MKKAALLLSLSMMLLVSQTHNASAQVTQPPTRSFWTPTKLGVCAVVVAGAAWILWPEAGLSEKERLALVAQIRVVEEAAAKPAENLTLDIDELVASRDPQASAKAVKRISATFTNADTVVRQNSGGNKKQRETRELALNQISDALVELKSIGESSDGPGLSPEITSAKQIVTRLYRYMEEKHPEELPADARKNLNSR